MLWFETDDWIKVKEGIEFTVECPRECKDFNWLLSQDVVINGQQFKVKGVHSFLKAQHHTGEKIGLFVNYIGKNKRAD